MAINLSAISHMLPKILRIATRKSPLALWQANYIAEALKQLLPTLTIELVPLVTSGDKFLKDKLIAVGGKGLFVKELEEALLDGRADLAVHSMKDVPAHFPAGLTLAAICKRHNPFDAFISTHYDSLDSLPYGSIVGTASFRRQAQLLALRADLIIKPLRGNINTRLAKLAADEYDAIILAAAGLERLGMDSSIRQIIPAHIMLPACGQGALGVECRLNDSTLLSLFEQLNDPLSALCVHSERQVNAQLGGNCHLPLAVFCSSEQPNHLTLRARVLTLDGRIMISNSQSSTIQQAAHLAQRCAQELLAQGAADLLVQANE